MLRRLVPMALAGLLAASCGGGGGSDDGARAVRVGGDGGTPLVEIPSGATDGDVEITIEDADPADLPGDLGDVEPIALHELSPDGLELDEPGAVTWRVDAADVESGADRRLLLPVTISGDGTAEMLRETSVVYGDDGDAEVRGALDHFSWVALYDSGIVVEVPTVAVNVGQSSYVEINVTGPGFQERYLRDIKLAEKPNTPVFDFTAGQVSCRQVGRGTLEAFVVIEARGIGEAFVEYALRYSQDVVGDRYAATLTVPVRCLGAALPPTTVPGVAPTSTAPPAPGAAGPIAAEPIIASLEVPTTTYSVAVTNRDTTRLTYTWSGANCGEATPSHSVYTWRHDGADCRHDTVDHADATITVTISDGRSTIVCRYFGAATGEGPPCDAPT